MIPVNLKNYRITGKIKSNSKSSSKSIQECEVDKIMKANNKEQARKKLFHSIKYSPPISLIPEKILLESIYRMKIEQI